MTQRTRPIYLLMLNPSLFDMTTIHRLSVRLNYLRRGYDNAGGAIILLIDSGEVRSIEISLIKGTKERI